MGGELVIARRIRDLEEQEPVRQCLQALFMNELDNADSVVFKYSDFYKRQIAKYAPAWDPAVADEDAQ